MTQEEFKNIVNESSSVAVNRANTYLKNLNLSLVINWEYDTWGCLNGDAIGVYENGSVFEGTISIGFNFKNLYKYCSKEIKDYSWSNPYTIINEAIQTNVFHEMGHGIVDLFNDYLQDTDELDSLYDNNQELFDWVLDNEEEAVEEFAWKFYDNEVEESQLGQVVNLYLRQCNIVNEEKLRKIIKECIRQYLKK